MALTGNWAMCGGRNSSTSIGSDLCRIVGQNLKSVRFGMANGVDWMKHRKYSAYKPQLICSVTDFIHWSRKIPIGDGYHEFL